MILTFLYGETAPGKLTIDVTPKSLGGFRASPYAHYEAAIERAILDCFDDVLSAGPIWCGDRLRWSRVPPMGSVDWPIMHAAIASAVRAVCTEIDLEWLPMVLAYVMPELTGEEDLCP